MLRTPLCSALLLLGVTAASPAQAHEPASAPATWGAPASQTTSTVAPPFLSERTDEDDGVRDPRAGAPVAKARELLVRAKQLDEGAAAEEKAATQLAASLPALRAGAKAARERADVAAGEGRDLLVSRAEELEADVVVSEAEVQWKRRVAAEMRAIARTLRARAVQLVRDPSSRPSWAADRYG